MSAVRISFFFFQVQYGETDLAFCERLMNEWGMYYYFEHEPGIHRMVLVDAPGAHQPSTQVSCPLSGSAFLLNFNPVFPNFSYSGLDFEGVNARLVRCVVPVLLPIQDFTQASALSGADSLS